VRSTQQLDRALRDLDGASYARYRSLTGPWGEGGVTVEILRVQADPFAPPSRVRLTVTDAGIPDAVRATPTRRRALATHLLRGLRRALYDTECHVDAGGQQVLERSAGRVDAEDTVVVDLAVPLPGPRRRIFGQEAATLLARTVPDAAGALTWAGTDALAAHRVVESVEDAVALRDALLARGLVAFVADGAVLPRRTGVDDRPMSGATPFTSPDRMRVTISTPNSGEVTGMGVPAGVTVIVGGGYHGKSTLLRALGAGVWDHLPDDGRERVVTRRDAVSVRAEDGRAVTRVDVSAFVAHLPSGAATDDFTTADASGSTSQAASIVESVEAGAHVLLVDEDTSATNLMVRDGRMQRLVPAEPLVPFVERVRPLHREHGVSTVLVTGGSGDYLDVADTVVMMERWVASEVTARAQAIAAESATRVVEHTGFPTVTARVVDPASLDPVGARGKRRVTARDQVTGATLTFGEDDIDLSAVGQLVDRAHVLGVGRALALLGDGVLEGTITLAEGLDLLEAEFTDRGAAALTGGRSEDLAVPRRHEIAAALNRLRSLRVAALRRPSAGTSG